MAKPNFRLILTIATIGIVVLLAITVIGLGYFEAASQSIGRYAPIGEPTNVKHK